MSNQPASSRSVAGPLPGMAVIAAWMLLLCALGLYGVVTHHLPLPVLVLCAFFAAAATGLLRQRRWGWALALAAAFLSMIYEGYMLARFHQTPAIVMIAVNLILFLYLVRPEVIERLK